MCGYSFCFGRRHVGQTEWNFLSTPGPVRKGPTSRLARLRVLPASIRRRRFQVFALVAMQNSSTMTRWMSSRTFAWHSARSKSRWMRKTMTQYVCVRARKKWWFQRFIFPDAAACVRVCLSVQRSSSAHRARRHIHFRSLIISSE